MNWTYSAIVYLYFIVVGACYFLGFWTPLHFNIFQFTSPVDILKSATYPLIPAALGILFFVLLDTVNSSETVTGKKPDKDDPKSAKVLYWVIILIILLLVIIKVISLASYLYSALISEPEKRLSYALPAISFISTIYLLINPPFLRDKSKFIRNFVIIFACALPTISYFQGEEDITSKIKSTSSYFYLKKSSKHCEVNSKSKQVYLGFYGGMYIFMNSNSQDICLEKDGGVLLSYFEYQQKTETEVAKNAN
jgi:NADH:ubiquinone oxidoreductase subunit 5 (subunit L)/multisubunit Na+/H+ antiporter MnhA subunit